MDLPTLLPPRSLHAQAVACFLQPLAGGRWRERDAEGAVPHSVCCVTSAPQEPQSRSCSVLHGPRACFMRWLWVEASLVLGCARGERCPWDNTPQRMLRRHLPLLEEKFQHISLRSLCRPLHPEFAALGGSSSVSFGLDPVSAVNSKACQLRWEMPANQWRPLLPYPSFSVCSQVLLVFTEFCGTKYRCLSPTPGKQNLAHPPGDLFFHSSLQAIALTYGLASFPLLPLISI